MEKLHMFDWWFETKTRYVLIKKFNYPPSPLTNPILKGLVAEARSQHLNQYDAAIKFMMVMMNSLEADGHPDTLNFLKVQARNIENNCFMAFSPFSDIISTLGIILQKHGLVGRTPVYADENSTKKIIYNTYDAWLLVYKEACGNINSNLQTEVEDSSLIDFMDQEPLRRAYRDGVDPKMLGAAFAQQFDINTFGRR